VTQLTNEPGEKFFPTWNLDGEHIAYTRRNPDKTDSIIIGVLSGWDPTSEVIDRTSIAKRAMMETQKTKSKKKGTEGEQRYDPRSEKEQGGGYK